MRWVGLIAVLVGCTEKNPLYCDRDGDCQSGSCDKRIHTCTVVSPGDGGLDGPLMHCMTDPNCPSSQPHCVEGICRQCIASTECSGGQVCQPSHSCGPCSQNGECDFAGGLCLRGACPPASDVAWADCAASMCPGDGSRLMPFCKLSDAANSNRPYVVMTPGTCNYDRAHVDSHTQEIIGNGAEIRVPGGQIGIQVAGASGNAFVHDLTITTLAGDATAGASVTNNGTLQLENVIIHDMLATTSSGVYAQNGTLTVRKCLIYGNRGWGIQVIDSIYRIENTFVLANGSILGTPISGSGGVRLNGNATGVFVYNTVARNQFETPMGIPKGAGVKCEAAAALIDSLLIENTQGLNLQDTQGSCTLTSSVTTTGALPQMANDIFVDPSRPQDCTMNRMGFHVKTTATMVVHRGVLQPTPTAQSDFDGDARPSLTTPGADEPAP